MSDKTIPLSNDLLKGVMTDALVCRGYYTNVDNVSQVGIYLGPGPQFLGTYPTGGKGAWPYGSLIVIVGRYGPIQIMISEYMDVAIRSHISGSWGSWKILATAD